MTDGNDPQDWFHIPVGLDEPITERAIFSYSERRFLHRSFPSTANAPLTRFCVGPLFLPRHD